MGVYCSKSKCLCCDLRIFKIAKKTQKAKVKQPENPVRLKNEKSIFPLILILRILLSLNKEETHQKDVSIQKTDEAKQRF